MSEGTGHRLLAKAMDHLGRVSSGESFIVDLVDAIFLIWRSHMNVPSHAEVCFSLEMEYEQWWRLVTERMG